ncbi:MAG: TldD/PmbA family protein [Chitinophagales bacterium]
MKDKLIKSGQWAVEQASSRGVEAESFVLHSAELSVEVTGGQVETLKQAEQIGIGIRVLQGKQVGFSFTTDLSETALRDTFEKAVMGAKYTGEDEFNGFPGKPAEYPQMQTYDEEIHSTDLEAKIELAREAERQARAVDKRVTVVERAGYEDSVYSIAIVNSRGVQAFQKGAYCGVYISLVAEENGDAQNGFSVMARKRIKEMDPVAVGKEGANIALRMLGAKSAPSASMPCILEPYVMTSFLNVLSDSFSADAVQKGKSALKGKVGQELASKELVLVDDGIYEKGVGSFPFDGEGWPCQHTVLIEDGVLRGFLYDTYTARKDKTVSTGNASRGSFRGGPSVGTTNFYLQPGRLTPENLRKDIVKGLYITEVMGMHTANPISGDFSVGASGIIIENGELKYPVRGLTIAGNLYGFLKDIDGIGNDLRFYGTTGAPSVRVKSLSIAGE